MLLRASRVDGDVKRRRPHFARGAFHVLCSCTRRQQNVARPSCDVTRPGAPCELVVTMGSSVILLTLMASSVFVTRARRMPSTNAHAPCELRTPEPFKKWRQLVTTATACRSYYSHVSDRAASPAPNTPPRGHRTLSRVHVLPFQGGIRGSAMAAERCVSKTTDTIRTWHAPRTSDGLDGGPHRRPAGPIRGLP